jgi:hypothetical protein
MAAGAAKYARDNFNGKQKCQLASFAEIYA